MIDQNIKMYNLWKSWVEKENDLIGELVKKYLKSIQLN